MTTRRQFLIGAAAFSCAGCVVEGGNESPSQPTPTPSPSPSPSPVDTPLYMLATKDGSVGQTYSAPQGLTGVQWFRETLTPDRTRTAIAGASGVTYVATAEDIGTRLVAVGTMNGQRSVAAALAVVLDIPVLLEGFDTAGGFTATNEALLSSRSALAQGSAAVEMQGTGSRLGGPGLRKSDIGYHDPVRFGTIAQFVDLGWDPIYGTATGFDLTLSRDGQEFRAPEPLLAPLYQTPQPLFFGTMWGSVHSSEIVGLQSAGAGRFGMANSVTTQVPDAPRIGVDALVARAGGRPTIVIGFDDILRTQYTEAFPYMRARNVKGGFHVAPGLIGGQNRMTLAQLREMYDAGWDCYLNGSYDDILMTDHPTVAAALADLQKVRDWAQANGMPRGNDFCCYPNGRYHVSPTRPRTFSARTYGTRIATMSDTTGIRPGMFVGGYNVPTGTTVVSVDSATQITLSTEVVAQVKAFNFNDLSSEFSYTKLPLALKAAGYKMARTTQGRGSWLSRFGIPDRGGILAPANATSNQSLEQLKADIDLTILRGETSEFYIHGLAENAAGQTDPAKFRGLIDHIVARRDAGQLDVLTKTELWMRDGKSSLPI
ncbi:hypothetical protein [Sphingomonas sp. 2378]|uniref:hypothetical protein n=1 Tax=Sphingomonas sp. 2378 TaxID=1219748 RepID=UPI00311AEFFB